MYSLAKIKNVVSSSDEHTHLEISYLVYVFDAGGRAWTERVVRQHSLSGLRDLMLYDAHVHVQMIELSRCSHTCHIVCDCVFVTNVVSMTPSGPLERS